MKPSLYGFWKRESTVWLNEHREDIELCIVRGIERWQEVHSESDWLVHQLKECYQLTMELSDGETIPYDLPAIGPVYASWYLAKRVNQALGVFLQLKSEIRKEELITLADLGCGTLACQIALGLLTAAVRDCNLGEWPDWDIHNYDSSAPMLDFGKRYLWPEFEHTFGKLPRFQTTYCLGPWQGTDLPAEGKRWIVGSYLFDKDQNVEQANTELRRMADKTKADRIILWTSRGKQQILESLQLVEDYDKNGRLTSGLLPECPIEGNLPNLEKIRSGLGIDATGSPQWLESIKSLFIFTRRQAEMHQVTNFYPNTVPARRMDEAILSPEQEKATHLSERPTQIIGPAGCGKTLVLLGHLKKILQIGGNLTERPKILLTAFNKDLIAYLSKQIEAYFSLKPEIDGSESSKKYSFKFQDQRSVELMHFDLLPTRLAEIKSQDGFISREEDVRQKFHDIASAGLQQTRWMGARGQADLLTDGAFLLEEYHRVIFGGKCEKYDDYATVERPQSTLTRTTFRHSGIERQFIWFVVEEFEKEFKTFITRRRLMWEKIKQGGQISGEKYTHVIVDEAQDCTPADYDIFFGLLKDPNKITVAADLAQAIHLGKSARLPRVDAPDNGRRQRNWERRKLLDCFRIPFWTAKAILPLSHKISAESQKEALPIQPHKGAVPGSRIILLKAADSQSLSRKILDCFQCYQQMWECYGLPKTSGPAVQILEKDKQLEKALLAIDTKIRLRCDSVFGLKGLERRFVVWSLNVPLPGSEKDEAAYTIATRCSGIMVIACAGEPHSDYENMSHWLDYDYVAAWDSESQLFCDQLLLQGR
jgi:DNA helicase-2/ATP-dependent DNA helicase PcrA